jgi:hypothetical protein
MKALFIALLVPVLSIGQTVHYEKKEIVYKGTVKLTGPSAHAQSANFYTAVQAAAKESKAQIDGNTNGPVFISQGKLRLIAPFRIIRELHFTLALTPQTNAYSYRIDSVYVTEKRRGGSETLRTSKELLEGIEDTGLKAIETERLLNEIDMRLQKILAVTERELNTQVVK